jgi:archaellum component FlaG (FlaF/FlaG flagellin family)
MVVRRVTVGMLVLLAAVVLVACRANGPLQVETIQLGRSLNPDNSIAAHATTFNRSDTVYVAVLTTAAGKGTIGVKWTYEGRVIDEPKREVSYREAAATEFHLVNSGGFPPGAYTVDVFVDGKSVGSRNFNVAK